MQRPAVIPASSGLTLILVAWCRFPSPHLRAAAVLVENLWAGKAIGKLTYAAIP